jgi:hypothetical protein
MQMLQFWYGNMELLHTIFNSHIWSERGFHQGDPIAGLLLALVLHPVLETIQAEVPNLHQGWFLDDGMLIGKQDELGQAADIITTMGPPQGLDMSTSLTIPAGSPSKSRVYTPPGIPWTQQPLGRGMEALQVLGFVFLGAPIGPKAYQRQHIKDTIQGVRDITWSWTPTQSTPCSGPALPSPRSCTA